MITHHKNLITTIFLAANLTASPLSAEEMIKQVDQAELMKMLDEKGMTEAFEFSFEAGDELTEAAFTADQGVGANVGEGRRFTRFPRADLTGPTEWANHFPTREGGANSTSCIACHNAPIANGAGDVALNVVVDPAHTGDPSKYLVRNTLPLFALAASQKLAEEMTIELHSQKEAAIGQTCSTGVSHIDLTAKNVSFGVLKATRLQKKPCTVELDFGQVQGIDNDLVVKAFGWKGNHSTIRSFTRGAANNELGLQAVELVGDKDGDFDSITNELSVGDLTALTVYMAALERPVSKLELANLKLVDLSKEMQDQIIVGESMFNSTGCGTCHIPEMKLHNTVFNEPSSTPGFFDVSFPSGDNPANHSFESSKPISFDMTKDQPNNQIPLSNGKIHHLGAFPTDDEGNALIKWFTDFKRHDMGAELADPADPLNIGASMWPTRSLAGVGSTGPWLHDGRATTLDEAILAHGGEAARIRNTYTRLENDDKAALVAYLENLVIYKYEANEK